MIIFLLIVAVIAQSTDNVERIIQEIPEMSPHYTIPAENFGDLGLHARNCTMLVARHVTIYCANDDKQDYFIELGTYSALMAAKTGKVDSNGFVKFDSPISMIAQNGDFVSFYDPDWTAFNEI
jgi:hypothetical protein